jgi:hypothetical protein
VQPENADRTGRDWLVRLLCPSCGWSGEELLDQGRLDDLDEAVEDGLASLAPALAQVTRANMQEYVERFSAALSTRAISSSTVSWGVSTGAAGADGFTAISLLSLVRRGRSGPSGWWRLRRVR